MTDLSYAQAAKELESILKDLENDNLDVDEIANKVQRATELIEICRSKVTAAKIAVKALGTENREG